METHSVLILQIQSDIKIQTMHLQTPLTPAPPESAGLNIWSRGYSSLPPPLIPTLRTVPGCRAGLRMDQVAEPLQDAVSQASLPAPPAGGR